MRSLINYSLVLLTGLLLGYAFHSLFGMNETIAKSGTTEFASVSKTSVSCDLTNEQIDHLSIRIAPFVVAQLAKSGLGGISADPRIAIEQDIAIEKTKKDQEAATNKANQLIDQMIANRRISPNGLSDAVQLLQQTGQADQSYKLMARISAAVNRGELTPEEAGLPAISSSQNH